MNDRIVARPALQRAIFDLVVRERSPVVALWGAGGFGKTTLARHVHDDPAVRSEYPDGVYWITLGQYCDDSALLSKLNDLVLLITGARPNLHDLTVAGWHLADVLGSRRALIVLDDIWRSRDLQPLLWLDGDVQYVLTTRDRGLVPDTAVTVPIGSMNDDESLGVLSYQVPATEGALRPLLKPCAGWAVLLRVTNGRIRDDLRSGRDVGSSVSRIKAAYERHGPYLFGEREVDYRDAVLAALLTDSVAQLPAELQSHYSTLAIFPEDAAIPVRLLARAWRLSVDRSEEVCRRLERAALVDRVVSVEDEGLHVFLHDSVRDTLRGNPDTDLPALNEAFLAAVRPVAGGPGAGTSWARLSEDESYLWRHVCWHLREAGAWDELATALTDLEFVARHTVEAGRRVTEREAALAAAFRDAVRPLADFLKFQGHLLDPLDEPTARQATLASYTEIRQWPTGPHLRLDWQRRWSDGDQASDGHVGIVTACAFDPRGSRVATAGSDGRVILSDLGPSGSLSHPQVLTGHQGWCRDVAFSHRGDLVASASDDGTVRIWSSASTDCRWVLEDHRGAVRACAFSPDDSWVVSASDDGTMKIWDLRTGACVRTLEGHTAAVRTCAVSGDGGAIASGSDDGFVKLWQPPTGEVTASFRPHGAAVWTVTFASRGGQVLTGSADGSLALTDIASGEVVRRFLGHRRPVRRCATSPTGEWIVSAAGDDGPARVWDTATGTVIAELRGHDSWVVGCAVDPSGRFLATSSVDGRALVWDATTFQLVGELAGLPTLLWAVDMTADGEAVVGAVDGTVAYVETATGRTLGSVRLPGGCTRSIEASAPQRTVYATNDAGTVTVLRARAPVASLAAHAASVRGCRLHGNGRLLVTGAHDGHVGIWEVDGDGLPALRHMIEAHSAEVLDCATSSFGPLRLAVSASRDGTFAVWDCDTAALLFRSPRMGSPLACCDACAAGDVVTVLTGSDDGRVLMWTGGPELHEFTARPLGTHAAWVTRIRLSEDRALAGSVSDDRTLRVWSLDDGLQLAALAVDEPLYSCAWAGPSTILAVGGGGVHRLGLTP